MLLVLPLLFSASLAAAAHLHPRRHPRHLVTKTELTITTTTVLATIYETQDGAPAQSSQTSVVAKPESVTSAAAYVPAYSVAPNLGRVTSSAVSVSPPSPVAAASSSSTSSSSTSSSSTSSAKATVSESNKAVTKVDSDTTLERMSDSAVEAIYKTCWNGQLQWPLPNTPNPVIDVVAPQLSIYALPDTKADTLTVNNYCSYEVYFEHFNGATNMESGNITAGATIDRPLSGTVMKVSKTADMAKDLLIEYGVDNGDVFYDLSLITCLGSTGGLENADTSACVGHEDGLQLGNAKAKSFQCAAGTWCDDQVYLYQENLCKKQNPVYSCDSSHGLAVEFCASKKP